MVSWPSCFMIVKDSTPSQKMVILLMRIFYCKLIIINPTALRTTKTKWRFGRSKCNRVNRLLKMFQLYSCKALLGAVVTVAGRTVKLILKQDTKRLEFITCIHRACVLDMMSTVT